MPNGNMKSWEWKNQLIIAGELNFISIFPLTPNNCVRRVENWLLIIRIWKFDEREIYLMKFWDFEKFKF